SFRALLAVVRGLLACVCLDPPQTVKLVAVIAGHIVVIAKQAPAVHDFLKNPVAALVHQDALGWLLARAGVDVVGDCHAASLVSFASSAAMRRPIQATQLIAHELPRAR